MDEPPHGDDRYCSNCGERIIRQANYCYYCGERLRTPRQGDHVADAHAGDRTGSSRGGSGDRATRSGDAREHGDVDRGDDRGGNSWNDPQRSPGREVSGASTGESRGAPTDVPGELLPDESPFRTVGAAAGLGVLGIVLLAVVSVIVGGILSAFAVSTAVLVLVGTAVGQYVGFGGLSLGYLRRRGYEWEQVRAYVGVRVPTIREFGVILAGYVAIVALLIVVAGLAAVFLPEPADNQASGIAADNPAIIPAMILMMFLVVGPMEELLFRGIVQNRLRERFSKAPAIVIASAIFASVHVVALAGDPAGMLVTVFILFFPATVFGAVYEYTGNIVVPALLHAIHNSVIVSLIFLAPEEEGEAILSVLALLGP